MVIYYKHIQGKKLHKAHEHNYKDYQNLSFKTVQLAQLTDTLSTFNTTVKRQL